ncbi:major facilitator superfamily transporter [Fusarium oxysporum f. sp. albedinis]|nr:major facilitator superfamily transporter [Fusarium oxysporum f. sp. albedinis]
METNQRFQTLAVSYKQLATERNWSPTSQQLKVMILLSALAFLVALDSCIIVTALHGIAVDLHLTANESFWVGTSFLLSNAVTMPLISGAGSVFGHARPLTASVLTFTAGTVFCCLAHSSPPLLIGRILQGIGAGGIMSLTLMIYADIVPLRHRPKWYGIVLASWAGGNCTGPVLGGLIVQKTTWRWVFYVMFPFCISGAIFTPRLLRDRAPRSNQRVLRLDLLGGLFLASSATLFLISISWGGVQFGWSSSGTLIPLSLGIAGLVWTWFYEQRLAQNPILQWRLFASASQISTYLCGSLQGIVLYGQLYYIPFYFTSLKAYSPIKTGLATLPVMLITVPSSVIAGGFVTRTKNYRLPIWLGWMLTATGSGLTLLFDASTPTAQWAAVLVVIGFGHGAVLNAQNFACQAMCNSGDEILAAAMYAFTRQFGMALGVGIGGSTFQNAMSIKLRQLNLPTEIAKNSEAYVVELHKLPDGAMMKQRIFDAYAFGFRGVFLFFTCVSGFGFLLSLVIKHFDMDRQTEEQRESDEIVRLARLHNISPPIRQYSEAGPFGSFQEISDPPAVLTRSRVQH